MKTTYLAIAILGIFALGLSPLVFGVPYSVAATCLTAGNTGLTAAVVATSGQTITGTINASGCDVGVYIGPGIVNVLITHATITGANDHGILSQDTAHLIVMDSLITGNGVAPHTCPTGVHIGCVNEDKAIQLVGTNYSVVENNNVSYNHADGGIAISDDGFVNPGGISGGNPHHASVGNEIINNTIDFNTNGCGVVIAGYNAGLGLVNNLVEGNTILGNFFPSHPGGAVGQIVVATDGPGSIVSGTRLIGNLIDGSLPPGIVIHSNAPGDVINNTFIMGNTIENNGQDRFGPFGTINSSPVPTGIAIISEDYVNVSGHVVPVPNGPKLNNTYVHDNTVLNDVYAVWVCNAGNTTVTSLFGNSTFGVVSCSTQSISGVTSSGVPEFPMGFFALVAIAAPMMLFIKSRRSAKIRSI